MHSNAQRTNRLRTSPTSRPAPLSTLDSAQAAVVPAASAGSSLSAADSVGKQQQA